MTDRRPIVDEAAEALADGVAVDWTAAIRRARSLEDRAVLRSLEMIGGMGLRARPQAMADRPTLRQTPGGGSRIRPIWRDGPERRALARRALAVAILLPPLGIGVFEVLRSSGTVHDVADHPAAAILAALSGIAMVLVMAGAPLPRLVVRALDRRRRPDAVVSAVTSYIRDAADERELADRLETIVSTALCVERVRLLVLDQAAAAFVHPRHRCTPLGCDSPLVAMLGDEDDVMAWPGDRDREMLNADEQSWLDSGPFVVLAPLRARTGTLLGVLAVGGAEDGLHPDLVDLEAVRAVACPIALVLEQVIVGGAPAGAADADRPATECRACGLVLAPLTPQCGCGGQTDTAALPQLVSGKFRIDRTLGAGAMGIAYLGRDLSLGRPVVVKALTRRSSTTTRQLAAEARAMAAVTHPALAGIFGLETWRGVPLLVMEFVPGGTLAARLREGPLSPAHALAMGRSLAGGLEALHAAGLHHHDIKPANIAIGGNGLPRLLDFGLAVQAAEDIGRDELAGTPLYLSPEAVAGRDVSESGDLWALSMVLYESIAGVNPFAGGDVADVLARVCAAQVPDIRAFCPGAPLAVSGLFRDLLATRPELRPASASELGSRLGAVARAMAAADMGTAHAVFEIPPERQSGHTWLAVSGGPASRS